MTGRMLGAAWWKRQDSISANAWSVRCPQGPLLSIHSLKIMQIIWASLSLSLFIFESIHTQDKLALFEDLGFCDAMDPDWEPLRLVLLMHINLILLRTNHTTIPEKNLGIQKHIEVSPVLWRRWRKNVADRKKCCKNRRSGSKQSLIRCDW